MTGARAREARMILPAPKPEIMARRDEIIAGLAALLPPDGLIGEPIR